MKLGIEGKKALVFGGSRGMGKACALQLSQEGVQVTIAAPRPRWPRRPPRLRRKAGSAWTMWWPT